MKRKILVLLTTSLAVMLLASCQTQRTKNEIYGKWAYSGHTIAYIFFHKNNTYEFRTLYGLSVIKTEGVYKVKGKTITTTNSEGDSQTLLMKDASTIYASDGSEYIKVEDY